MMKSEYTTQEHLNILIDDKPLDILLHEIYPDKLLLGLVPTIVEWLDSNDEVELVYSRFVSNQSQAILPILMCPDDCDFSCTIIVAEVVSNEESVRWNRIGIDNSERSDINKTGTIVEWLEKVPAFCFDINDYKQLERIYRQAKK
ncbi:hypothetical protein [Paenibacillus campinasensis]|uniref:Uncharacterized protein n=1 Tax=Paenibacillus campinasensis TaxID=66347 RepID=A0A268ENJ4_9BACL|nr:hypothetical protein [Paenibacillus campinasensis]PAD74697.1 hypothetical protein CHH67_17135 [Paenibacillus campinasensis]